MYHENHPDGSYEMANRVLVFEPPRLISWEPGYVSPATEPQVRNPHGYQPSDEQRVGPCPVGQRAHRRVVRRRREPAGRV
jgi:hypothetical protein